MNNQITWEQLDEKEKQLTRKQKENLPNIIKKFDELGYDVAGIKIVKDGWCTGFKIYHFICTDRRSCKRDENKTFRFVGNDDNTAIFEIHESGAKSLFKKV